MGILSKLRDWLLSVIYFIFGTKNKVASDKSNLDLMIGILNHKVELVEERLRIKP
jgi:hypothetical protein